METDILILNLHFCVFCLTFCITAEDKQVWVAYIGFNRSRNPGSETDSLLINDIIIVGNEMEESHGFCLFEIPLKELDLGTAMYDKAVMQESLFVLIVIFTEELSFYFGSLWFPLKHLVPTVPIFADITCPR